MPREKMWTSLLLYLSGCQQSDWSQLRQSLQWCVFPWPPTSSPACCTVHPICLKGAQGLPASPFQTHTSSYSTIHFYSKMLLFNTSTIQKVNSVGTGWWRFPEFEVEVEESKKRARIRHICMCPALKCTWQTNFSTYCSDTSYCSELLTALIEIHIVLGQV